MNPLTNIGVSAARAAGRVIMKHYRQGTLGEIKTKARNDFVTEVDREAENVIIHTIRRAHPHHAILAEESGRDGAADGKDDVLWIIDPIDGTTNFIHGIPHFCVSIGCQVHGELSHAVVYDPFKEELFTASRGTGASLDGRRIRVANTLHLHSALLATGFAYRKTQPLETHLPEFNSVLEQCADVRRGGSAALDLAYVAAGRLDGYWERGLAPWDIAAGLLLVQEAGGITGDITGRDPLDTGDVVAGTPKVFAALQAALAG